MRKTIAITISELKALKDDIDEVEKMLKELVKSVENNHLDP